MENEFFFNYDTMPDPMDRVDGKMKVTGAAKYASEHPVEDVHYGVLVGSTIARGVIKNIDTRAAERAPGVIGVLTYLNSPKVPGYDAGGNPVKGRTTGQPLRVFYDEVIYFNGQPIALVVADTFERAVHAASLVKAQYDAEKHSTDINANLDKAVYPRGRSNDYTRGNADAYKTAPVKIEAEYIVPVEVHLPMELHSIIAKWDGEDKVTVYDKTQGVKSTQRSIMQAFKLTEQNVQVYAPFVGGGFGSALRTWPHEIAALLGAKKTGKPVKLVLGRDQMFTMVGYRPYTIQKFGIGATADGKIVGMSHEAISQTSTYEEFTEGTVNMTRFLYDVPNVFTRYKIIPLDVSTPTWMRGPGEATGSFALESAIDELAYALNMDPLELRLKNYAETDPEKNRPFSSKFLKDAYQLGADKIGWYQRNRQPRSMRENGWLAGYGMSTGTFSASRGNASASARLSADGKLVIQSAVADSGPGTATVMTQIASETVGWPANKITFELGDSSLPPGPTQGGSTTTSTEGSAVHAVSVALQKKLGELAIKASPGFSNAKTEDLVFENGKVILSTNKTTAVSYTDILKHNNLNQVEVTSDSKSLNDQKYSMYSFSVHFVKVLVNPLTGVVKVNRAVSVADAGRIVNEKTAASQIIGGVTGGIGMALMEEGILDNRYGRWINNNFADYHVPVSADVPDIDSLFVNKPDPIINPMGAKGMGEIALIGFAAAVTNAVYHATGKRIRALPVTLDKLI